MDAIRRHVALGLAAFTAVLSIGTQVHAQRKTGVVLSFDGRGAGAARNVVVSHLSGEVELVPRSRVQEAARRIGVGTSGSGLRKLAAELDIDLFIRGRVAWRGRRVRTQIRVYDARGEELARRRVITSTGPRGREKLGEMAVEAVREAVTVAAEQSSHSASPRPSAQPSGPTSGSSQPGTRGAGRALESRESSDSAPADETAPASSDPPVLDVRAGAGARRRRASVGLSNGERRIYEGTFPELTLTAELRPLASFGELASGLFVTLDSAVAVGLSSKDDNGNEVGTDAFRVRASSGYLAPLTDRVQLGGSVGYAYDAFVVGDNAVMPSAQYSQARLAVRSDVTLVPRLLIARAEIAGRFAPRIGDLGDAFADGASARGVDFELGLGGALDAGLSYGARFGYRRYKLDFSGAGSDGRGTGGTDRGWHVTGQLGWQIR